MTEQAQNDIGVRLLRVFTEYCGGQTTMDGKSFAKLAKDTRLIDKGLAAIDVDLIFAKIKAKFDRRITFDQFIWGLEIIAEKKKTKVADVKQKVATSKGPKLVGTKASSVKLHDNKSLYTGIYGRGGPKIKDKPRVIDLDGELCGRGNSDFHGIK